MGNALQQEVKKQTVLTFDTLFPDFNDEVNQMLEEAELQLKKEENEVTLDASINAILFPPSRYCGSLTSTYNTLLFDKIRESTPLCPTIQLSLKRNPSDFRTIDGVVYLVRTQVVEGQIQERLYIYVPSQLYGLVTSEHHMPTM